MGFLPFLKVRCVNRKNKSKSIILFAVNESKNLTFLIVWNERANMTYPMTNDDLRTLRQQEEERIQAKEIEAEVDRIASYVIQSAKHRSEQHCNVPIFDRTLYARHMRTIMKKVNMKFPECYLSIMLGKQIANGVYIQQKELNETLLKIMEAVMDDEFFTRIYRFGHHLHMLVNWSECRRV